MGASYIYDAVRSPFGRLGRGLAGIRPDDLAARTIASLLLRHPGLDPARIDDVIVGAANQAGEDNRNVGRFAALLADLPVSVPGATVNRLCGSSMESVIQASRAVEVGDADLIVAGGVESMSRAPWVVTKPSKPYLVQDQTMWSTTLGWRMTNPALPVEWTASNGSVAEDLAERLHISRDEQDAFAMRSHLLATQAWEEGLYGEVLPVHGTDIVRDEGVRPDTTLEALGNLPAAFREGGTVTAGNSSPLSDGASMVLVGAEGALPSEPLARIVSRVVVGNLPHHFPIAPVEAANRALEKAGRRWKDVDLVELNEAFAVQALACMKLWPELDPDRLNVHGGAVALGHPLGASGGRIIGHLAHELTRRGGRVGVATLCIGVGQALAIVLER